MSLWRHLESAAVAAACILGLAAPGRAASEPIGQSGQAIYGGSVATECEWPSVVALGESCSGTLVHPRLLVYAAHCGTSFDSAVFGETVGAPRRRISLEHCEGHPEFEFGNGADLAYCKLSEPMAEVPIIPLAAGCEVASIEAGLPVTFVGFGFDRDFSGLGVKRFGTAYVTEVGQLIKIESEHSNTCPGDSGGPVFASLRDLGVALDDALRLIAVTSTGPDVHCAPNWGYYVSLPSLIPWLEHSSGLDLTPCFDDDGAWAPSSGCVDSPSAETRCTIASDAGYRFAKSCGAPLGTDRPAAAERFEEPDIASDGVYDSTGCTLGNRRPSSENWLKWLAVGLIVGAVTRRRAARSLAVYSLASTPAPTES